MKKTWVLYSRLSHHQALEKPIYKDKQPVSPRQTDYYEIQHTIIVIHTYIQLKWETIINHPRGRSDCVAFVYIKVKFSRFDGRRLTSRKRPFLMSWRWCLHEALPYVHQTNMSWKHSPTHGLTVFKRKYMNFSWYCKIMLYFFCK